MLKITWRYIVDNRYLLFRYAVVGSISAFFDFSILFILTDFVGLHYLFSATVAFSFAATSNYWFNKKWTFKSNGQHRKQLPVFFTFAILGLLLNNSIIFLAVELLTWHYLWGKLFAAVMVTFWNFFGNRYITFRK